MAIQAARTAAATAATAAMTASNLARDAVADLDDALYMGMHPTDEALARAAAARAANESANAAAASTDAANATTPEAAEAAKIKAEAAQARAEDERTHAVDLAGDIVDRVDEANALAKAKMDAMTAATMARAAADAARAAAMKVADLTGDDSAQTTAANQHATNAESAAMKAETANTSAQEATESGVADGFRMTAETEQGNAEGERDDALELEREAQVASDTVDENNRKTYASEAQGYADGAEGHYEAVKAQVPEVQAQLDQAITDAAEATARLERARKSVPEGIAAAVAAAGAAKTAVDAALTAAMTAMEAAATAAQEAADSTSAADAKTARDAAKDAYDDAAARTMGADQALLDAMNAVGAITTAEGMSLHTIPLFMEANAYDITGDIDDNSATPELDESMPQEMRRRTERNAVGAAMALAANATDGDADGGVSVAVDWPFDADMPILRGVAGLTNGDEGNPATTREMSGLGDFGHGFSYVLPTGTDGNSQLLVFSDKDKEVAGVTELPGRNVVNIAVTNANIRSLTPAGGTSFTGTYDDDDDAGTPVLTGTFNCTEDTCSLDYTTAADGTVTVTTGTGYTFSGSRAARAAVEADAQEDYLAFGIWLSEATDGTDTFGAIYGGGASYAANVGNVITGTATYNGSAFGAHHKTNEAVSYFNGRATLMADFGADDAAGTVEGSIDQIYVDGNAYGDVIRLVRTTLTDADATFNGAAVMGPQTAPGEASHAYNGTWSGSFFGASAAIADDPDTLDVDETVAAGARAPDAVAGSFGVTRSSGDDATTTVESFVGAFGARQGN